MKKIVLIGIISILLGWTIYEMGLPKQESTSIKGSSQFDDNVGIHKGNVAPDFELTTLDGKKVKLSDYRGKKILLNFWATWCPPCREEIPDMQKLYSQYHEQGLEILAINLTASEASKSDVETFKKDFNLEFPILFDENSNAVDQYLVQSIPTSFFIDTEGIIKQKIVGTMSFEFMLEEINALN